VVLNRKNINPEGVKSLPFMLFIKKIMITLKKINIWTPKHSFASKMLENITHTEMNSINRIYFNTLFSAESSSGMLRLKNGG